MEASVVPKKLTSILGQSMIQNFSLPIYTLQSKFKNNTRLGTFDSPLNTKNATNGRLLKLAITSGLLSVIGIILILTMMILGLVQ